MRSLVLAQAGSRLVVEEKHGRYDVSEMTLLAQMGFAAVRGALVLMDRGFCCVAAMEAVLKAGGDFLVRVPANRVVKFVKEIGPGDSLVDLVLTKKMLRDHPHLVNLAPDGKLRLRMLSYKPEGGKDEITLLTSLTDPKIKPGELCMLYHERWEVESVFDEIKTQLCERKTVNDPVLFRGRTAERVEQEWLMLLIAHNAVRMTMAIAAATNKNGKHGGNPWRLSYTRTLARLRDSIRDMGRAADWELPRLYAKMITDVETFYVHPRPNRHFARAVKIKMSKFLCKGSLLGENADAA
jgi:hypothetical protein